MKTLVLFAAGAMFLAAGCAEPTGTTSYSDRLVVNAYLIGGQPIDSVYVQHTGNVTELYTAETAAIGNATVIITGNNFSDTLMHDPARRGHYLSRHRDNRIRPGSSYSLAVSVPGYGDASGTTTVPDTFSVTNSGAFPPSVSYRPAAAPYAVVWSPSGRFADYLVVVRSVDLHSARIPKSFANDEEPERTQTGFFLKDVNRTEISWLFFQYYGKTDISVVAVDQNYFDLLKQLVVAQGATDIREIRFNLIGAIGVFAAETVANNHIEVTVVP